MSELVERVAEVLWASSSDNRQDRSWSECPSYTKVELRRTARAAIEAARECLCNPTDKMRDAYSDAEEASDHPAECHPNPTRLRAMIDAALSPERTPETESVT